MDWKKEAARQGYRYRKTMKTVHKLTLEVTLTKLETQILDTKRQIDSDKEMTKVLKAKDTIRSKYINYIKKFNEVNQEIDILKLKFIESNDENNKLKQEINLLKREIKAVHEDDTLKHEIVLLKKEVKSAKKENSKLQQEKEELEQLLEPLSNELKISVETNALLINLLELDPEELYQVVKSNTTLENQSNQETVTNTQEKLSPLPVKPNRPKKEKPTKRPNKRKL